MVKLMCKGKSTVTWYVVLFDFSRGAFFSLEAADFHNIEIMRKYIDQLVGAYWKWVQRLYRTLYLDQESSLALAELFERGHSYRIRKFFHSRGSQCNEAASNKLLRFVKGWYVASCYLFKSIFHDSFDSLLIGRSHIMDLPPARHMQTSMSGCIFEFSQPHTIFILPFLQSSTSDYLNELRGR